MPYCWFSEQDEESALSVGRKRVQRILEHNIHYIYFCFRTFWFASKSKSVHFQSRIFFLRQWLSISLTVIWCGFFLMLFLTLFSFHFGEGNGTLLQYSCLENPMEGGAWKAAVHGVAKGWTWLSDFTFTFHFHALEKEMATHSSVLAWRIPGMGKPDGLPSMGSHRVGHDWSDLAVAAAVTT